MSGGAGHPSQHAAAPPWTNGQNFVRRVGLYFGFSETGRRGQTHTHFLLSHCRHVGNREALRKGGRPTSCFQVWIHAGKRKVIHLEMK